KDKVQVIKLLQIIICKFEAFRSNHFYYHQVQSNSFEDLKGNIQFNETILTINIMFKLILEICYVRFNILNVLEICNFAFFIKIKYPSIFLKLGSLQSITNENFKENENFDCEFDTKSQLININFSSSFTLSNFYKTQLINLEENWCI
ncbi:hypothetical protein H312_00007, partial [Anncaliia algerae PRA339]